MADKYLNADAVRAIKNYITGQSPPLSTQGNWTYRLYDHGYFEAWYKQTGYTATINNASGSLYRSPLLTLTLPSAITSLGSVDIMHTDINCAHNNYPAWGMLGSLSGANINFYAMSGGSRGASPNYVLTAYAVGTVT